MIKSPDMKSYAYILHDKCKKEDSDELKKPHYHFMAQFYTNQRGSWFKAFATDDMGIVFIEPTRDPERAFAYLIHDTDACKKANKHLYDPSERISTIDDFTGDTKENEHEELLFDITELSERKISWYEFMKRKPKRIHMIGNIKTAVELISNERNGYNYNAPPPFAPRPTPSPPRPQPPPQRHEMRVLSPDECKDLPW